MGTSKFLQHLHVNLNQELIEVNINEDFFDNLLRNLRKSNKYYTYDSYQKKVKEELTKIQINKKYIEIKGKVYTSSKISSELSKKFNSLFKFLVRNKNLEKKYATISITNRSIYGEKKIINTERVNQSKSKNFIKSNFLILKIRTSLKKDYIHKREQEINDTVIKDKYLQQRIINESEKKRTVDELENVLDNISTHLPDKYFNFVQEVLNLYLEKNLLKDETVIRDFLSCLREVISKKIDKHKISQQIEYFDYKNQEKIQEFEKNLSYMDSNILNSIKKVFEKGISKKNYLLPLKINTFQKNEMKDYEKDIISYKTHITSEEIKKTQNIQYNYKNLFAIKKTIKTINLLELLTVWEIRENIISFCLIYGKKNEEFLLFTKIYEYLEKSKSLRINIETVLKSEEVRKHYNELFFLLNQESNEKKIQDFLERVNLKEEKISDIKIKKYLHIKKLNITDDHTKGLTKKLLTQDNLENEEILFLTEKKILEEHQLYTLQNIPIEMEYTTVIEYIDKEKEQYKLNIPKQINQQKYISLKIIPPNFEYKDSQKSEKRLYWIISNYLYIHAISQYEEDLPFGIEIDEKTNESIDVLVDFLNTNTRNRFFINKNEQILNMNQLNIEHKISEIEIENSTLFIYLKENITDTNIFENLNYKKSFQGEIYQLEKQEKNINIFKKIRNIYYQLSEFDEFIQNLASIIKEKKTLKDVIYIVKLQNDNLSLKDIINKENIFNLSNIKKIKNLLNNYGRNFYPFINKSLWVKTKIKHSIEEFLINSEFNQDRIEKDNLSINEYVSIEKIKHSEKFIKQQSLNIISLPNTHEYKELQNYYLTEGVIKKEEQLKKILTIYFLTRGYVINKNMSRGKFQDYHEYMVDYLTEKNYISIYNYKINITNLLMTIKKEVNKK